MMAGSRKKILGPVIHYNLKDPTCVATMGWLSIRYKFSVAHLLLKLVVEGQRRWLL